MSWISDAWNVLTGKPQSWYDRIDRDQKALAVRSAEVNAIGQDAWGQVRDAYLAQAQGPGVDFLSFSDINAGIDSALKSLLITNSHTPSDQDIQAAEDWNAQYGRYIDYVKGVLPELSQEIASDAAAVQAQLSHGSLQSPAAMGQQAFVDEVERRAAVLGAGFGAGALLYFGIPMLLILFMGRGRG